MNAIAQTPSAVVQPEPVRKPWFARLGSLWHADFLSPKDLVRRALAIALIYGLASACGMREFTSILNGTMGSIALGWRLSAFLGLFYIAIYLAFVLLVPMLLIAAGLLMLRKKVVK